MANGWTWENEALVSVGGRFEIRECMGARGTPVCVLLDRGRWAGDFITKRGAKAEAARLAQMRAA